MIVQDDKHCFGKPRIEGTGIPVEMIVSRFTAGDSIDTLTDDYNISQMQVEEALRYYLNNRNNGEK